MRDELGLDYALTGYGLTEAHATVAITYPDDPPEVIANCRAVRCRVWRCALSMTWARRFRSVSAVRSWCGGSTCRLVYDEPEATAAVFQADGWLHTGDIAYMNASGYIKICDRKKDMFIVGGFNVAPTEVEGILTAWEKISAAAVIGVSGPPLWGGGGGLRGAGAWSSHLVRRCDRLRRMQSATTRCPAGSRGVRLDALPLNATGKVLRNEFRARAAPTSDRGYRLPWRSRQGRGSRCIDRSAEVDGRRSW